MKIVQMYEFSKEDLKMLHKSLGKSPCLGCQSARDGSCCGCPSGREYEDKIKEYKNSNLYDFAIKLQERKELLKKKENIESKIQKINSSLPKEIVNIIPE